MNPAIWTSAGTPNACLPDPAGSDGPDRITRNIYDAAGQRLQLREGVASADEAAKATWAYNGNGQVTAVIDGNGNRAELRYDGHMRQDRWTFPSANGPPGSVNANDYEQYAYDAAGNRVSLRKRDGSLLQYEYDALNRMIRKIVPERSGLDPAHTRDVYYAYDLRNAPLYGRFDSASGPGVVNSYDAFGRLASTTTDFAGPAPRTLSYAWDSAGRRIRITHPDQQWFGVIRDGLGRPFWGYSPDPAGYHYQAYYTDGLPGSRATANGVTTWVSRDDMGRLNGLGHYYIYGSTTGPNDVTWLYQSNPASQMRSATRDNDGYAWTGHYRVQRPYTTNGLNQYTAAGGAAFGYDPNGNLTSDGTGNYVYDVENRLVSASNGAQLRYDPLGRLYEVTATTPAATTTRFLYDGSALVAEYDAAGTMTRRYFHWDGADVPIISYQGSSLANASYLHADHQGSIVAVSSGSPAAVQINRYDEFGIPAMNSAGDNINTGRFQYTGQVWLSEIGMYYYKARIYSPTLGRFLQTDPIGYHDQFNLYAYVGNDPVNGRDPSGAARICSVDTGSRISSCVTVDADVDNDGRDDLTRVQQARIGSAYAGFIHRNDGANISGNGKDVTGDAALKDRAMVSVASQFVGAALGNSPHWRNLTGIRATSSGEGMRRPGPEEVEIQPDGRWTMTLSPNFPSGTFYNSIAWFRNTYNSPSNLARVMLHGTGHAFMGIGGDLAAEQRVDRYARYALGRYGLSGEGCWDAAFVYPAC